MYNIFYKVRVSLVFLGFLDGETENRTDYCGFEFHETESDLQVLDNRPDRVGRVGRFESVPAQP